MLDKFKRHIEARIREGKENQRINATNLAHAIQTRLDAAGLRCDQCDSGPHFKVDIKLITTADGEGYSVSVPTGCEHLTPRIIEIRREASDSITLKTFSK